LNRESTDVFIIVYYCPCIQKLIYVDAIHSKNPILYSIILIQIREVLQNVPRPDGLYPNFLRPETGEWGEHHTSLGAYGDSFYEYLIKEWIRSGKKDLQVRRVLE
jgi:mannosyl-oligosaccharide alpha-1,2-mannosidase